MKALRMDFSLEILMSAMTIHGDGWAPQWKERCYGVNVKEGNIKERKGRRIHLVLTETARRMGLRGGASVRVNSIIHLKTCPARE